MLIAILCLLIVVAVLLLIVISKLSQGMERGLSQSAEKLDKLMRTEFSLSREEQSRTLSFTRDELNHSMIRFSDSVLSRIEKIESKVEQKLAQIQEDNALKLNEMRTVVEEKLQSTLETQLGMSFKIVSQRLEEVQRGLGEMANLAQGVGDLKRVLTNVKSRGGWGEKQLHNLLSELLTPDQFKINTATKPNSKERVEFAIRLPGKGSEEVLLPIDAKFPKEDYERLLDGYDKADAQLVEQAASAIETRIKAEAKTIRDKYIEPPYTTDFAILFLPVEGLYAEVLRRPGLADSLQREFRVVIAGPTNLAALLNSLQMGFRTLAIEKRSAEVWKVLGAVKTEFGKFGVVVDKISKKLQEAAEQVDAVGTRTRMLQKTLTSVEAQSEDSTNLILEKIDPE